MRLVLINIKCNCVEFKEGRYSNVFLILCMLIFSNLLQWFQDRIPFYIFLENIDLALIFPQIIKLPVAFFIAPLISLELFLFHLEFPHKTSLDI